MDNQQELNGFEIGWLCGFFDGEGYVGMNITNNYSAMKNLNTRRKTIIIPRLIVSNTDYPAVMFFKNLLNRAGVGVHILTGRKNSPKHKTIYRGEIHGFKRVSSALPIFLNGCVIKKPALEVISRWILHRKDEYQYSLKDYEFYQEFMKASDKIPNDSTLRRLYDSCSAELYKPRDFPTMAWESRRKVESNPHEKSAVV
jgi:hypothetical protein